MNIEEYYGKYIDLKETIANYWVELKEIIDAKDWKRFCEYVCCRYEIMADAVKEYYEEIPDDLKHEFIIGCYTNHGDSIPIVRQKVREALKYRNAELPNGLENQRVITIYRAGEETIDKAKYRLSWTTDKDVALFFRYIYRSGHASHLYRGEIEPKKVIAYTDEREEREIIQYRNVRNIVEINDEIDVAAFMEKWENSQTEYYDKLIEQFSKLDD